VLAEDFEDHTPTFVDSADEDELDPVTPEVGGAHWHEWQMDNMDEQECMLVCLVCDSAADTIGGLLKHMKVRLMFHAYSLLFSKTLD
jgi:hypothetical protein